METSLISVKRERFLAINYLTNRGATRRGLKFMEVTFLNLRFPTLASVEKRLEIESENLASDRSQYEARCKRQEDERKTERSATAYRVKELLKKCIENHGEGSEELFHLVPLDLRYKLKAKLAEVLKLRDRWEATAIYEKIQALLTQFAAYSIDEQGKQYVKLEKLRISLARDWLSKEAADLALQATEHISELRINLTNELRLQLESSVGAWPNEKPPEQFLRTAAVASNVEPLLMYNVLALPLAKRLKFHFGNVHRDTHRPEKPQWMLDFILKKQLGPARKMGVDPIQLWEALRPEVVDILFTTYPDPSLNVRETELFDNSAAEEMGLDANLTAAYVSQVEEDFLSIESKRILGSLEDVLENPNADNVDFDWSGPTKPMFGAHNAMQIWRDSIALIRGLPQETQHLSIAKWVKPLLDSLYSRYISASETSEIAKLVRLLGSTSYIESVLRTYGAVEILINESFEDYMESFARLRDQIANQAARLLRRELQSQLRVYFSVDWSSEQVFTPAAAVIDSIWEPIKLITRVVGPADRLSIIMPFSSAVAELFWRSVIQANVFSSAGGLRLREDIDAIWSCWGLAPAQGSRIRAAATYLAGEPSTLSDEDLSSIRRRRV